MLHRTWLPWLKPGSGSIRRGDRHRPARRPSFVPRLETLEDRTVPSTLTVTNNLDTGVAGDGSLRGEIAAAQSGDTIVFDTSLQGQTITLTRGYLDPVSLDIEGLGADQLAIRGNPYAGVFGIGRGGTGTIAGLTITGGFGCSVSNDGTLTLNNCNVSDNQHGQGISNSGTLTLNNCNVSGNYIVDSNGGGIWNVGTATLNNSAVWDNDAVEAEGKGIFNAGALTLNNSTVTDNWGIGTVNYSALTLNNSTAADGIYNQGTLNASNTIIQSLGGNPVASGSYNLITGFGGARLDWLRNNGGPTLTMALLPGSPALNAGDPGQLGVPDQRDVVRAGGVNIGAYQASASAFVLTAPATVTSGTPFGVTVQAVDVFGQVAFGYRGTVTFSVTDPDPAVVLPADYAFTADDQGTHTFSGAFTLITPGTWTLTVADLANGLRIDVTLTVNP
jgi:fibronectin-binding autotransporter adhesin